MLRCRAILSRGNRAGGNGTISYIYDATGVKQKKIVSSGSTTDYAGNYIYKDGSLEFMSHPEGYIEPDRASFDYVYQYKDHLGNIRLSYKDISTTSTPNLQIQEENNYYPFGLKHKGYNSNISGVEHKWKYNGKELQDELDLNWYDLGARNLDHALGRFMNVDPRAEDYNFQSVYAFANNNPVRFVDINGEGVDGDFIDENGNKIGSDGIDDGKVYVIKTDITSVESGAPIDGITTEQKNSTVSFIKSNDGNTTAFQENKIAYENSVEIEGQESTRQNVVDIVNQDDGTGGRTESNTKEYGGTIDNNGNVVESKNTGARYVTHKITKNTKSTFHSHRSGLVNNSKGNPTRAAEGPSYHSANSTRGDINNNRPSRTNYVFDRRTGRVYIYNTNSGVHAVIPQSNFVKLPNK